MSKLHYICKKEILLIETACTYELAITEHALKKVKFSFDFMLTEILKVPSSEMPLTSTVVLFFFQC